jgi:hypothetical protein
LDGDRTVTRETTVSQGPKSGYILTVGWLMGHTLAANEPFDLRACVGKTYLVTVGPKVNKAGQPTGWNEVTACIALPGQKA